MFNQSGQTVGHQVNIGGGLVRQAIRRFGKTAFLAALHSVAHNVTAINFALYESVTGDTESREILLRQIEVAVSNASKSSSDAWLEAEERMAQKEKRENSESE